MSLKMATNNILGFCTGANPNVTSVANWQAKPSRTSGFVSGIAISSDINASIAGGANIAHAVGEFIKNQLNEDVNPTDETALVSQFLRALQIFIQRGGACPVGSIIPYLGGEVPYGWLLANGASVLRTQYQKLFGVIGTKFGASDEAHFNLPNLHHRFIEGTTTLSEVGSYVEAGLPNIPGNISHLREQGQPQPNGAFQSYGCDYGVEIVRKAGESRPYAWETVKFLANLVSTVYSDTVTTVQPASLRMHCLIRYQ